MAIDFDDVHDIAHLARLAIEESKIPEYTENLTRVLDLVDQMAVFDTTETEPLAHPLDAFQRLRADSVTELDQRDMLLKNAPLTEKGYFLVPKVIE